MILSDAVYKPRGTCDDIESRGKKWSSTISVNLSIIKKLLTDFAVNFFLQYHLNFIEPEIESWVLIEREKSWMGRGQRKTKKRANRENKPEDKRCWNSMIGDSRFSHRRPPKCVSFFFRFLFLSYFFFVASLRLDFVVVLSRVRCSCVISRYLLGPWQNEITRRAHDPLRTVIRSDSWRNPSSYVSLLIHGDLISCLFSRTYVFPHLTSSDFSFRFFSWTTVSSTRWWFFCLFARTNHVNRQTTSYSSNYYNYSSPTTISPTLSIVSEGS